MHEITVRTKQRVEMIDITSIVKDHLQKEGVKSGICTVYVPHTTAGVTINENADPDVVVDILATLDRLIPLQGNYRHMEGNSDAHLKSTLVGASTQVIIREGRLMLGTWQSVFFCEFDGPRQRKVWINFIGGK